MKLSYHILPILLGATSVSESAAIFTEDFQTPDVTGYSQGTRPSNWVAAGGGYGSDRHGLIDEDSGAFNGQSTPLVDDGEQAYAFRYTSSPAIVTTAGLIGTVANDQTITVIFDAVEDLGDNEGSAVQYDAYLFAIADGATRASNFGGTGWTQLARLTGDVTPGTTWETGIQFSYTTTLADSAVFGQDYAIAFTDSWTGSGGDSSALIDNISVIPESSSVFLGGLGMLLMLRRRRR
jgi:hypothetical protein